MKHFPHGTNAVHSQRRDTLGRWQAVGVLIVFLVGITLIVGVSCHRNIEGEYRAYWFGREL